MTKPFLIVLLVISFVYNAVLVAMLYKAKDRLEKSRLELRVMTERFETANKRMRQVEQALPGWF